MECDRYVSPSDREAVGSYNLHPEARLELEKQITLGGASHPTPSRLKAKTRILRASDVLLSLAGRSTSDPSERAGGLENFQEVLRLFPPFRDDDGATFGAIDVKCPDCDAVFSSSTELNNHYLTRFCPGAAVAVYVMTRDRLITKGYRMEKRLIPLDCRPMRFFCNSCERHFAVGDNGERVDRQRNMPSFVTCKHCGEKCNISSVSTHHCPVREHAEVSFLHDSHRYEPILNDPRDDASFRDVQRDLSSIAHSRSPSLAPKSTMGSKFPTTPVSGIDQPSFARRARKLRDSWSHRKFSQSDEDELIAISFAGIYDLEKVHAPNGTYQQFEGSATETNGQSVSSFTSSACDTPILGSKRDELTLCGDEHHRNHLQAESQGDLMYPNGSPQDNTVSSKRQSFLQKLFGRKTPKGPSRARSTSNRGKKLIKRANTIRFSLVAKYARSESRAATRETLGTADESQPADTPEIRQEPDSPVVSDAEYVALLRGSQNVFIHMQYISGGAVVHDESGRQRILQMDEVAQLYLQLKDELSAATIWSQALTTRLRAEAALNQGNYTAAVVEYHDALKMLEVTPALDADKLSRAAMLHSLGQAYRNLDMPTESEACYLESLGLYKRTLGRDNQKNYAVLHDLGALCEKDGYATEAAALYERSFAGRLKTLGNNAPETLSSMQDLASLKVSLGDLESALLLLEKAVPALDTVFGLQNATTLNAMNQLSLLYQKLGLDNESRTICGRTIPHCRTFFGITSPITRDVVVRYLQSSENFDFPADIKDVLDQYQRSRDPDALRVIHRLGRSYMDAGLNRDAADLFEALVEDFLAVRGPEAPETFDALSALCVSREHLDSVDKAILAYKQLVHMAGRTPEHHHSRKRIGYAEKRISELNRRRDILAAERKEWMLHEPGLCENCGCTTTVLCNTCKIFRFCNESCHQLGVAAHFPYCIPSVSLRESKSLAVKPKCPTSMRDQAISKIRRFNGTSDGNKSVTVTASFTFYLDPRNFSTFRMRLNNAANTVILFSLDSDIQYTTIDNPPLDLSTSTNTNTTTSSPVSSTSTSATDLKGVQWLSPDRQEAICYEPGDASATQSRYVLVTPGREMLKTLIDKRVGVRAGGGDADRFKSLELPDNELIEYAQGLLLTGYLGEAFMYVIEWVWK
ncbi:hypothetical protein P170DRAFT_509943 [Aspergillus steynii IBT 23096]|uniref:Suppressor of anucleate metulae protein B n=1 Tax=Aspergillus steynii IBT 23096 TaxID=1392250 RepID=A0A2I2G934_9EURO|nr:uncharacterized protein P170DRAFT_509943 [Aspergillus steynii IBT 23096]PLB49391.1 hypothetical protein P170DRAFT_509943 [Aspergillus steynii IBT 23096]